MHSSATPDALYAGFEIGGTKCQAVLGNDRGEIHRRVRWAVDRARGRAGILEWLDRLATDWAGLAIRGLGVGFGGPVDGPAGLIACSHQVDGWEGYPLASRLAEKWGAPCVLENDSNAAALAEALLGAGRGSDPVFYTNSGSGVGGGLVVGGRIYHGAPPGEAEIGQLRLDRTGATVESVCSGWAVDRRLASLVGELAARGESLSIPPRHLGEALAMNLPGARQLLEETAASLAFALSHVVHLFHPQTIVLGGGLALIGEPWRAAVAAALAPWIVPAFRPAPPIRLAALGEDLVPVGALLLAAARP